MRELYYLLDDENKNIERKVKRSKRKVDTLYNLLFIN